MSSYTQIDYSTDVKKILDTKERQEVGNQIVSLLRFDLGKLDKLTCLDVGCSNGVITKLLAGNFNQVVGIDIDRKAIKKAKKDFHQKNLKFFLMDSIKLDFKDFSFDVLVCNQVYNFVDNPEKMMSEIYRVLKPRGKCFFGARNKIAFWDPQYDLPFLSILPSRVSEWIIRFLKIGVKYHSRYKTYFGIKKLCMGFIIHDYTISIIKNPNKYGFDRFTKYQYISKLIPDFVIGLLMPLVPNYIWILEKN